MDDIFREPGTTGLEAITVRELRADDLEAIVRIDAGTVGRRRPEYYQRKLAEAMRESGIKISLAAETEGMFAGFLRTLDFRPVPTLSLQKKLG
jgi:hypothetical protein